MADAPEIFDAYSACKPLGVANTTGLVNRGVHLDALDWDPARKLFKVMCAPVDMRGIFFEFVEAGPRAFIFMCRNEHGEVADLAAWSPSEGRTALWLGEVSMLGEETVTLPRASADCLWVHPSPLEWLQHRRTGVVVLNFDKARPLLAAGSPVSVHTKAFRDKLDAAWRAPRVRMVEVGHAETVLRAV